MQTKKQSRRALFMSVISVILCLAMLAGTTMAWFSDQVNSGVNTIKSGNLDVELEYSHDMKDWKTVKDSTELFDKDALWEPGYTEVVYLRLTNKGNLALTYNFAMTFAETEGVNVAGETFKLSEHLMYGVKPVTEAYSDRDAARKDVAESATALTTYSKKGEMVTQNQSETLAMVVYMPETVDNTANHNGKDVPQINMNINLFATQLQSEEDSFDKTYDKEAVSGFAAANADGSFYKEVVIAPSANPDKETTIAAPEGSFDPGAAVEVVVSTENTLFNVAAEGNNAIAELNVTLLVDGEEFSEDLPGDRVFTVTTYISTGLNNVTVQYTGNDGKSQPENVTYDSETGKLTFTTTHFSEYAVYGAALAYVGDNAITDVEELIESIETAVVPEHNKDNVQEELKDAEDADDVMEVISAAKIDETYYVTLAEAWAAVQSGDTITLVNDVVYDADTTLTVESGKTITLDLNEKTLAGTTDGTGSNRNLFDVRGTMNVKNGTVTVEHTGENFGRSYSTNVFNVTAGGVLNIDDAAVKNLGGSDMAIGVHMNNWGNVTLTVTNSSIESTYCAIRVFNSGNDENHLTIQKSTIKSLGSLAIWVHNYVDDIENQTYEQIDGRLKFNIYNNDNTITGETTNTPIRYGFTNSVCFSADGETAQVYTNAGLDAALKKGATTINLTEGDFIIPDSAQRKTLTINGVEGSNILVQNDGSNEGCDYSLDGATVEFNNVTITTDSHTYAGYARLKATYNNCTFNGTYTLFDESTFNNCTFNVAGDAYNIWTWGAGKATFDGCIFNSDGKSMLVYNSNCEVTLNSPVFNDKGGLADLKAAIETGTDNNSTYYTITVNNPTVNGYEINDKGTHTGSTLWANKNAMPSDKLKVVVDGVEVSKNTYIKDAEALVKFAKDVNENGNSYAGRTVMLTADIDLKGIDWEPIGQTGATTFKGVFDGQGYTISNMSVDSEEETGANYASGLFGWVESHGDENVTIKNVNVKGATIKGHHDCAVIVGYLYGTVDNCHVYSSTVSCTHANSDADGDKAGAIAGYVGDSKTIVKNCSATGCTISAGRDAGIIAGASKVGNVSNCTANNVLVTSNGTSTGKNINSEIIGRVL